MAQLESKISSELATLKQGIETMEKVLVNYYMLFSEITMHKP